MSPKYSQARMQKIARNLIKKRIKTARNDAIMYARNGKMNLFHVCKEGMQDLGIGVSKNQPVTMQNLMKKQF